MNQLEPENRNNEKVLDLLSHSVGFAHPSGEKHKLFHFDSGFYISCCHSNYNDFILNRNGSQVTVSVQSFLEWIIADTKSRNRNLPETVLNAYRLITAK